MILPSRTSAAFGLLSLAFALIGGWTMAPGLSTTSASLFDASASLGPDEKTKPETSYGLSDPRLGF